MIVFFQELIAVIQSEIITFTGFTNIPGVIDLLTSGDVSWVLTLVGFTTLLGFFFPAMVFLEMAISGVKGTFRWKNFKMQVMIYFTNRVIGKIITLQLGFTLIALLEPYRFLDTSVTWYWFIYGYLVYDFSHFTQHFLAHKVRIFWCLHATHHVPPHMNMSVSWSHFYIENFYADIIRIGMCAMAGVELPIMIVVLMIDSIWGHVIHVSEEVLPDGRLGFLGKILLTPSHHRIHHAKNPNYIDTNFCNLLPIFDRLFGTYQAEIEGEPPIYGVTREVNTQSLFDVYFGEIVSLCRDIKNTKGLGNMFAYLVMPPGWHPAAKRQLKKRHKKRRV